MNAARTAISRDGKLVLAYTRDDEAQNASVLVVPYAGGKPTIVARGAVEPSWNR